MFEVQDSPVICFDCQPASRSEGADGEMAVARKYHSALMITKNVGIFPPGTLFELSHTQVRGFRDPKGRVVNQKLLTVRATYQLSFESTKVDGASKMCGSVPVLSYGSRDAYVKGLGRLLSKPTLTMDKECTRDRTFVDYKGVKYSLREQWEYVNGPAIKLDGRTPGFRDEQNDGKTPSDFLTEVNIYIEERREQSDKLKQLPESAAYLTLDEVIAVRLYSGPVYQLLNGFLRQLFLLGIEHREFMVHNIDLTFGATVRHLYRAIRKLAAVALVDYGGQPLALYRATRGELPKAFWMVDDRNEVVATETGFMSTSRNKETPFRYMGDDDRNILWTVAAKDQDTEGFHHGADISMLSQFSGEEEVLFPPCTILVLQDRTPPAVKQEGGRQFSDLAATPSFV